MGDTPVEGKFAPSRWLLRGSARAKLLSMALGLWVALLDPGRHVAAWSGASQERPGGDAMTIGREGSVICVETDALSARINTEGYVSGIAGGTLLDKKTGARDLGFGLDVVDFLLEPKWDEPGISPELRYLRDPMLHGNLPKRYVELPQICTRAKKIDASIFRGKDFVGVKLSFRYTTATYGRKPGSLWEQHMVFPRGTRYFFASDRITSVNDVDSLILRVDMPGHLKHQKGDPFEKIYLSYEGEIAARDFMEDFPPDARHLYHRREDRIPSRFIRAYKIRGKGMPWLAGMTLNPASVYEAWCHQRGYVCFIQEIGGTQVNSGQAFGAAYIIGFFDSVSQMEDVYDKYGGWHGIEIVPGGEADGAAFRWILLEARNPGSHAPRGSWSQDLGRP